MKKEERVEQPASKNPELFTGIKLGHVKKIAVGLPAVISSFKKVISEAGVKRGLTALKHLNQKGGFDCQSCAWPDPDDDRAVLRNIVRMAPGQ